jgi:hypothetical protein
MSGLCFGAETANKNTVRNPLISVCKMKVLEQHQLKKNNVQVPEQEPHQQHLQTPMKKKKLKKKNNKR